jgi:hypothetical protein
MPIVVEHVKKFLALGEFRGRLTRGYHRAWKDPCDRIGELLAADHHRGGPVGRDQPLDKRERHDFRLMAGHRHVWEDRRASVNCWARRNMAAIVAVRPSDHSRLN